MLKQVLKIPDFFVTETRELDREEQGGINPSFVFLMHFLTPSLLEDTAGDNQPNFSFSEPTPSMIILGDITRREGFDHFFWIAGKTRTVPFLGGAGAGLFPGHLFLEQERASRIQTELL